MAQISRETVYRLGKLVLINAGVQNTGGILTPLTKNYSYEDIVNALGVVAHDRPVDAVPYLKAVLKGKEKKETVPVAGGQWGMRMENYKKTKFWPIHFGPKPGEEGCQVPQELL